MFIYNALDVYDNVILIELQYNTTSLYCVKPYLLRKHVNLNISSSYKEVIEVSCFNSWV